MYELILFIRKHQDCLLGDGAVARLLKEEVLSVNEMECRN